MIRFKEKNPVLLIVDVQKAFLDEAYWGGNRNNKDAEAICGVILNVWREKSLPIIHIRHDSSNPDSLLNKSNESFSFNEHVKPYDNEVIITKKVNSAFIGTNLDEILKKINTNAIVIVGLTTDHCVSTTTRMAGNLGYETFVVSDATATFDRIGLDGKKYDSELIHQTALASLNGEFATIIKHNELIRYVK